MGLGRRAELKCLEDKGKKYKLGCYLWHPESGENEILSTKTGTVQELKAWATGPKCATFQCDCFDHFTVPNMYWTWCVWPNTWRCPGHRDETGAFKHILVEVKNNKKKHCEKIAKKSKCDPNHQIIWP